jgi:hypothetical protein
MVWFGLIWLGIGSVGGILWTRYWTFGFHKMLGSSWVAAQLAGTQEGLSSLSVYDYIVLSPHYTCVVLVSPSELGRAEPNLCRMLCNYWGSLHWWSVVCLFSPQGKLFCYGGAPSGVLVSAPIKFRSASFVGEITSVCVAELRFTPVINIFMNYRYIPRMYILDINVIFGISTCRRSLTFS